jgi:hypothetical protein
MITHFEIQLMHVLHAEIHDVKLASNKGASWHDAFHCAWHVNIFSAFVLLFSGKTLLAYFYSTCLGMEINTRARTRTHTHTYTHTRAHTHIHTDARTHTYTHARAHAHTHILHTDTHAHTHTRTHIKTYIHTHLYHVHAFSLII